MQVRMLTQVSGTRNGELWPAPGDTIDLPDDEANDLIATGSAAVAADFPVLESPPWPDVPVVNDLPVGGMVWNNELHATEADLVRRPDANSDTVVKVGTASEEVVHAREDTREAMRNANTPARKPARSSMTTDNTGLTGKPVAAKPADPKR